jgi:hypothetical protein
MVGSLQVFLPSKLCLHGEKVGTVGLKVTTDNHILDQWIDSLKLETFHKVSAVEGITLP